MPGTLRVHWTIRTSSAVTPRPILRCSRCDQPRPFEPSGKFRLNANGKRLDAWLIYRCAACGDSWNRPIFERRRRGEIDDKALEALQCNDAFLAEEVARDVAGLARWSTRFADEAETGLAVDKVAPEGSPGEVDRLAISLALSGGAAIRCDRVLAAGLGISRGRVAALAADGRIVVDGVGRKLLARMLGNGALLTLAIDGLSDAPLLRRRAAGLDAAEPSAVGEFPD